MSQQRDEVGRSGIYPATGPRPENAEVITPGDINEGRTGQHKGPGVDRNDEVKGAERLPRKGDEADDELGTGEDD
jgi:hypothetical protein